MNLTALIGQLSSSLTPEALQLLSGNPSLQRTFLIRLARQMISSNNPSLETLLPAMSKEEVSSLLQPGIELNVLSLLLQYTTPSINYLQQAVKSGRLELVEMILPLVDLGQLGIGELRRLIIASNEVLTYVLIGDNEVPEGYSSRISTRDLLLTLPEDTQDESISALLLSDKRIVLTRHVSQVALWSVRKTRSKILNTYATLEGISLLELQDELASGDGFNMLLIRAVLIQGLQGEELFKWIALREPDLTSQVARDILAGREATCIIHSVFLRLLYPTMPIPEGELASLLSVIH